MKLYRTLAVAIILPVSSLAVARTMNMSQGASGRSPAYKALMASMQKMDKDMNVKPAGNADMDFVKMMIPHHQGAIDMARVELKYGKDRQMRRLAANIVKAQEREIREMKTWEASHGK